MAKKTEMQIEKYRKAIDFVQNLKIDEAEEKEIAESKKEEKQEQYVFDF